MKLLVACTGLPDENRIKVNKDGPDLESEAIIMTRMIGIGRGVFSKDREWVTSVLVQKEGTMKATVLLFNPNKHYVYRLPEGRYFLRGVWQEFPPFNFGSNVNSPIFDRANGIQVEPFEVKAGEVLYLGKLSIHGLNFEDGFTQARDDVAYSVTDEFDQAKAALAEKYPDLAPNLERRFLKPLVLFEGAQ